MMTCKNLPQVKVCDMLSCSSFRLTVFRSFLHIMQTFGSMGLVPDGAVTDLDCNLVDRFCLGRGVTGSSSGSSYKIMCRYM